MVDSKRVRLTLHLEVEPVDWLRVASSFFVDQFLYGWAQVCRGLSIVWSGFKMWWSCWAWVVPRLWSQQDGPSQLPVRSSLTSPPSAVTHLSPGTETHKSNGPPSSTAAQLPAVTMAYKASVSCLPRRKSLHQKQRRKLISPSWHLPARLWLTKVIEEVWWSQMMFWIESRRGFFDLDHLYSVPSHSSCTRWGRPDIASE